MALVGQRCSHALHPVQFSAMMVNGMLFASLLLHLSEDLVGATFFNQLVILTRFAKGQPGKVED